MFSKIVSLLLFTILSVSSYAQVLVSNIPVFDLTKLNQEGLPRHRLRHYWFYH